MTESSLRFNFDDFDAQIADALNERRTQSVAEHRIEDALLCAEGLTFAAIQRSQELYGDSIVEDDVPLELLGDHPTLF